MFTTRRADGAKLRALREDRGLSMAALGQLMQAERGRPVSKSYLHRIEHGKVQPSPFLLASLAAVLGVDLDEFSTREPIQDAA